MQGKASKPFSMPDAIKITEQWRHSLSYAGDERFEQEIKEKLISVTYAGISYKTLNMTRKYALLSGVLPAITFFQIGNIVLGKYLNWLVKSVIWSLSKLARHLLWHAWAIRSPSGTEELPLQEHGDKVSTCASFSLLSSLTRQRGSRLELPAFPAFSSATEQSYCTDSCVTSGSVTSQTFLTPSNNPNLDVA